MYYNIQNTKLETKNIFFVFFTNQKFHHLLSNNSKLNLIILWLRNPTVQFAKPCSLHSCQTHNRSSHPEMFLGKGALKKCSKFTGELPCRSAISIKLFCFALQLKITIRHGCSPVHLLHIFRTAFLKNTSGWLKFQVILKLIYVW